ncbi:MAG: SPOR domain-containing protein [Treponema sp.]|nr:SPOR domain-containing protein [Treponema sp.]
MKKILRLLLLFFLLYSSVAALYAASAEEGEKSALTLRANALQKENVRESLKYLTSHIDLAKNASEKRSILYYTATLEESLGQFVAASSTYAAAASIDAADAPGMPAASNAELFLFAARSSLEACDFQSADSYLDAQALNSCDDDKLIAMKRLLSVWSALCKANDYNEAKAVASRLEDFVDDAKLVDIRRNVLFTLWYVTEDSKWKDALVKDYPKSPEAAIAAGKGVVMAMPFWYFMPRASLQNNNKSEASSGVAAGDSGERKKPSAVREQIGFFRERENAQKLVERAGKSGFTAYYYSEVRSSGTEYYVVVVDEDEEGSIGKKLRSAGFDCYPIKD